MYLSKPVKRFFALLAIASLLFCFAAGIAQARHMGLAGDDLVMAGDGCHTLGDQHSQDKGAHAPCDSAKAPSDVFELPTITPRLLITLAVSLLVMTASVLIRSTNATPALFAGAPPPLRLLQCRLRN